MTVSGIIGSAFHTFWIGDEVWDYDEHAELQAGMLTLGAKGMGYLVNTAAHTGYIRVILEYVASPPIILDDEWEDIAVATLSLSTDRLYAASVGGLGEAVELALPDAGLYGIQVSGKNRVEDDRSFDETDPAETYLVQVWSASRTMEPQSIRLTSDWGLENMSDE